MILYFLCDVFRGFYIFLFPGKMKKHTQHIAFLLLLFFGYSILFQNLHILFHDHLDIHNNCTSGQTGINHFCASDNLCGHSSGSIDQDNNPGHPKQPGINQPDHHSHEAVHCPVCEHEFAKFSITKIFNVDFSTEFLSFVTPGLYKAPRILYDGNHVSLRAPPSVI